MAGGYAGSPWSGAGHQSQAELATVKAAGVSVLDTATGWASAALQ